MKQLICVFICIVSLCANAKADSELNKVFIPLDGGRYLHTFQVLEDKDPMYDQFYSDWEDSILEGNTELFAFIKKSEALKAFDSSNIETSCVVNMNRSASGTDIDIEVSIDYDGISTRARLLIINGGDVMRDYTCIFEGDKRTPIHPINFLFQDQMVKELNVQVQSQVTVDPEKLAKEFLVTYKTSGCLK